MFMWEQAGTKKRAQEQRLQLGIRAPHSTRVGGPADGRAASASALPRGKHRQHAGPCSAPSGANYEPQRSLRDEASYRGHSWSITRLQGRSRAHAKPQLTGMPQKLTHRHNREDQAPAFAPGMLSPGSLGQIQTKN